MPKKKTSKSTVRGVETITHKGERRVAIPTQDLQAIVPDETKAPVSVSFKKRDPDLDPQLIWHGKYDGDETLTVLAPPLYIQEKIHPRAIIDELIAESKKRKKEAPGETPELFSDFNGVPAGVEKTDFYKHDQNWTNRMISGDSLQVMASLLNREGMRGKVQCVYMDPPYGIKFNSNFQSSTMSRNSREGTREPEMIKAFRDTWKDEIHSYLTYLRDRFLVARDLLSDSGSIFVQIGDQNVHRVRVLLDEVFGEGNFESQITYTSTSGLVKDGLSKATNYLLWYCKNKELRKYRPLYIEKSFGGEGSSQYKRIQLENGEKMSIRDFEERTDCEFDYERSHELYGSCRVYRLDNMVSQGGRNDPSFVFQGREFTPKGNWKPGLKGMGVLAKADRIETLGATLGYVRYLEDFPAFSRNNVWTDTTLGNKKIYVVQTGTEIVKRCILMCTDPGDLVLDPTCGSGTTAYVAEQWGRRWITIDTSRVALALARSRIMAARYPWYLLADSEEGKRKEAELSGKFWDGKSPTWNNIKLGFVNERIPHIMLNSISNNKEIEEIYEEFQKDLEPLREELNKALSKNWQEWEIPREAEASWSREAKKLHEEWWEKRIERQRKIDKSIETHSEFEQLYDKPFEDTSVVRVAGPFTVESTSEHRVLALDPENNVVDPAEKVSGEGSSDFDEMILNNVKKYGVQQGNKEDRILFNEIERHPGAYICAIAKYDTGKKVRRAGIFIGPEFATVSRASLVDASKEAAEKCGCDDVICFGFNYEAMVTDLKNLGKINIIKAKINEELHMGDDTLKGGGNLFVVFGEPDIEIIDDSNDPEKIVVKIRGVDVFAPNNAEIRSDGTDNIACWFIDTDYNGESFFVRHAYFCGDRDPYDALKRSLNAEIDKEAWESLHKTVSRPFPRPENGKIAVKVINGYGDEVMKIFDVSKK